MTTRRTRRSGSPPAPPEPRPLVETNGALAIRVMEAQLPKIEKLDPSDWDAIDEAQRYLLSDVGRVFGDGSPEWLLIFQNNIINEPTHLNPHGYDDDPYEGSWQYTDKTAKVKAGIEKMLPRIRRLIERAKELAALHGEQGGDPMNPFTVFEEPFLLIRANGERCPARGIWGDDSLTVHNASFSAAVGDAIERTYPNGFVERREVVNVRFQRGVRGAMPDAYVLDLRSSNSRPVARAAAPVVNHHTTYNIHGSTVGAVGENAAVASSHVIGQATQWNGADPKAIAAELKTLRKELAAAADGEGEDAAHAEADLEHVNAANKAVAANDEASPKCAMSEESQRLRVEAVRTRDHRRNDRVPPSPRCAPACAALRRAAGAPRTRVDRGV